MMRVPVAPEPLLMLATFNGEFIRTVVPEGSVQRNYTYPGSQCERSKSRVRCSARMLIIGNTTIDSATVLDVDGLGIAMVAPDGAFVIAPLISAFRTKQVAESKLSGIGLLDLP